MVTNVAPHGIFGDPDFVTSSLLRQVRAGGYAKIESQQLPHTMVSQLTWSGERQQIDFPSAKSTA